MKSIDQAEEDVLGLERKLNASEAEVRDLESKRPGPVLLAEQGNAGPLRKLDGEIDKAKARNATIQDARIAARHQVRIARGEVELPLILRDYQSAISRLEPALARLLEGLREASAAYHQLIEMGKASRVRVMYPSFPGERVLLEVASVVGVQIREPFLHPEQATVAEVKDEVKASIQDLELRAESGPKTAQLPRAEDQPSGGLGAIARF